eukprot:6444937-Heterocapsa_arctica.AAC.1
MFPGMLLAWIYRQTRCYRKNSRPDMRNTPQKVCMPETARKDFILFSGHTVGQESDKFAGMEPKEKESSGTEQAAIMSMAGV